MTWKPGKPSRQTRQARLKSREEDASTLIDAGDYKAACNVAMQAVQAELARAYRERPDDGAVLYAYYTRELFKVAESVQSHVIPSDRDLHRVQLAWSMRPRPRTMTPKGAPR